MPTQTKSIMGFDFGRRRIGVAIGQTLTRAASPLTTIAHRNEPDWAAIERLIAEWQPDMLLVGLPLHADGSPSPLSQQAHSFSLQLKKRFRLSVLTIDERLSSREAEQLLAQSPKRSQRRNKAAVDSLAAAIIVETWLHQEAATGVEV